MDATRPTSTTTQPGSSVTSRPAARLVSLDAFRGLTMASMVVVNNPGSWSAVYAPLLHAEWHGWTPTDLIFPFFLFIVGVSATLSKGTMGPWGRILRRTAIIAGLGLLLAGFPRFPLATWRIPGVLQRIALCYLTAVAIYRWMAPRDRTRLLAHAIRLTVWAAVLLLVYWAVMMLVPVPGGGAGNLSPGGDVGAYIDRALMGRHLWRQQTWDPEGLLSTVPAVATTLLGMVTGLWLASGATPQRKVHMLVRAGLVAILVGLAWNIAFPINKNLWTSSYAVFAGGAAVLVFAVCYWFLDVRGWRRWSHPFVVLGLNAITLFVASGLFTKILINIKLTGPDGRLTTLYNYLYVVVYAPFLPPKIASLAFALSHLVLLYGLCHLLYRKRIFLKA